MNLALELFWLSIKTIDIYSLRVFYLPDFELDFVNKNIRPKTYYEFKTSRGNVNKKIRIQYSGIL